MARVPLTPDELQAIRDGHAAGKSLSSIARELGRSPSAVATHARKMGLGWDASRTAQATEAKQASNRDRRARLVGRLYDRADKIMDRLEAETFKYVGESWGKAVVTPIPSDAIPGNEERALTGMVVNLLAGAARLEAVDASSASNSEAKGILAEFGAHLQAAYGQLAHTANTPSAQAVLEDATNTDADLADT